MKTFTVGVIMNGVTGRMGTNQHLIRSILAIRRQGGVKISDGVILPDPILVGRNENKLKALADANAIPKFSTDLDTCLSDPAYRIYFDSQITKLRAESVLKAIKAGKDVYCEKPVAASFSEAVLLCKEAAGAKVKNGVVQDKLWLPGIIKLKHLIDTKYFGKILSVRAEFGYWVFDGRSQSAQRPSWNYRKEDGGGIILDMFAHWRYLIDNLFGNITSVSCVRATHIPQRLDELGREYACTADDAAYATFRCDSGVVCQINSSWAARVRRDGLLTLQVDGTDGSAVADLRRCHIQPLSKTPRCNWNPDVDQPIDYRGNWDEYQPSQDYDNAFKVEWELFLRHVVRDEPFRWTFLEGAKGIQLAGVAEESAKEGRWIDVPPIE
ncbi:MAG: Gfo/Idh/MocA family oxidoreductase [Bacteroidota bacterium]|jgi:predicted dehydrogenase